MVSNVRLRAFQSSMFGGDAKPRGVVPDVSQIVTSCPASPYGSGRSNVASTSAKIALLAPMPSASVSTATSVKAGAAQQLPERELDVFSQLFEPQGDAHLSISLSAKVHTRPFEACHVAHLLDRAARAPPPDPSRRR